MPTPHFFRNFGEIDDWIAVDTVNRMSVLRELAFDGSSPCAPDLRIRIRGWLDLQAEHERKKIEAISLDLSRRNADAAEAATAAATESAQTSGVSARAALFAAIVSFLALIVSVAAYMKS